MRTPNLLIPRFLGVPALVVLALLFAAPAGARSPNLSRYPLRLHVLASENTHKTPRMSPSESVVCDAIDDMVSSISPSAGGFISLSGLSGDPCSLHPEMVTGQLLNAQDYDPVFSGDGRADLVSPPAGTHGLSFHYDNCSRVRVQAGFQSLPARWKSPGKKLEVVIPSDDIPVNGHALPPVRCTFTVAVHDFIYLLLPNGKLIEVSQEDYWKRPALRVFLSGVTQAVQQRPRDFTVAAHPIN